MFGARARRLRSPRPPPVARPSCSRLGYRTHRRPRSARDPRVRLRSNHEPTASITYAKTDVVLRTLEGYLGADKFEAAMRHYYEKCALPPSARERLRAPVRRGRRRGPALVLEAGAVDAPRCSTTRCCQVDDAAQAAARRPVRRDGGAREEEEPEEARQNAPWISEVVVHRKGELRVPRRAAGRVRGRQREARDAGTAAAWRAALEALRPTRAAAGRAGRRSTPTTRCAARRQSLEQRTPASSATRRRAGASSAGFAACLSTLLSAVGF